MAQDQEEDLSAIAWPGFVDILSAVIIMFVFFLMIVATSLYFHIIIYISKVESNIAAEQIETDNEFEFQQIQTEFADSIEQTISVNQEQGELVIFFNDDAISVLPTIKQETTDAIGEFFSQENPNDYQIIISASKPEANISQVARQVAVARMLNVRNTVIEASVGSAAIIPKIVESYPIEDKSRWVKIEFIPRAAQEN